MIRESASLARRTLRRLGKYARQRLTPSGASPAALFVVGAQRSGTTMLMRVLDEHPETWVYQEYQRAAFLPDWHIRPAPVRRRLVERARCRWVAFKPLFDTQNLDRLLEDHPGSKAIFLFRHYRDVASSSAEKWGRAMQNAVRRLATEDPCDHWMAERLPAERKRLLSQLYHEDISVESASALRWYLRNEIFFDLALDAGADRVMLMRYEDLVQKPGESLRALFAFLDLAFDAALVSGVSTTSLDRGRGVAIEPRVEALCEDVMGRLLAVQRRRGAPP